MAAKPDRATTAGRARRSGQADSSAFAGGRGGSAVARRISSEPAFANVDFGAGVGNRVRERGQPDAGTRNYAETTNIHPGRARRFAVEQIRQVLIESVVLAVLGGIVGVAIAYGGTSLILRLAFQNTYVAIHASPSLPVLAFTFGVAVLTGILFGVAPAWITANAAPADALRGAGRSTGRSRGWTQKSLVIAQAALSLVLLTTAGLLTQSLYNMQRQNFGFETPNRYIVHIDPVMAGYKPEQMQALFRQLHDSLAAIPGVSQVSFSLYTPMEGDNWGETVYIDGQAPPPPDSDQNSASWLRVSAGYFETLGTKIVQGRSFSEQDSATSERVGMVNQAFAKKFFKGENALGHHFGYIEQKYAGSFEIVGVTEDTQYRDASRKSHQCFFCRPHRASCLTIRASRLLKSARTT